MTSPERADGYKPWAVGAILTGAFVLLGLIPILESAGQAHTAPGKIEAVTFVQGGRAGKFVVEPHWAIEVCTKGDEGSVAVDRRPPDWVRPNAPVKVTFSHGLLYGSFVVLDLSPDASPEATNLYC